MILIVMTIVTMMKIMGMREGFIGLCVGREVPYRSVGTGIYRGQHLSPGSL
jgi:hypothetical protein